MITSANIATMIMRFQSLGVTVVIEIRPGYTDKDMYIACARDVNSLTRIALAESEERGSVYDAIQSLSHRAGRVIDRLDRQPS